MPSSPADAGLPRPRRRYAGRRRRAQNAHHERQIIMRRGDNEPRARGDCVRARPTAARDADGASRRRGSDTRVDRRHRPRRRDAALMGAPRTPRLLYVRRPARACRAGGNPARRGADPARRHPDAPRGPQAPQGSRRAERRLAARGRDPRTASRVGGRSRDPPRARVQHRSRQGPGEAAVPRPS